jgi:hypothetical protein
MAYVIKYRCGWQTGYFDGGSYALPGFGATKRTAMRFRTKRAAEEAILAFPILCSPCCTAVAAKRSDDRGDGR